MPAIHVYTLFIHTRSWLRVKGCEDLFCIGDCAMVEEYPLPGIACIHCTSILVECSILYAMNTVYYRVMYSSVERILLYTYAV